ncbi:MAG: exonuclease SbcCD subunit D [Candidatus Hermodarchaeota archaeon]
MTHVKFMHVADLHLGKSQYSLKTRYEDYFRAFESLLNKAIEQEVDFILICGDLIDSEKGVSPSMLRKIITSIQSFNTQSQKILDREIPLICIEGNHETPFFSDHTWLNLLADLDLVILLSGIYDNNAISFPEYSITNHSGGKIKIKTCNIYGVSYFGSSTPELFPLLANAIEKKEAEFNILMMHFGISGYDQRKAGIELTSSLKNLKNSVDYLALGHFHNQYMEPKQDPWIFNPGSLEANDIEEVSSERGIFLVEIFENSKIEVRRLMCQNGSTSDAFSLPNRRFLHIKEINISDLPSFNEAQDFILQKLKKYGVPLKTNQLIEEWDLNLPLVYLTVTGTIGYSRLDVDFQKLREKILDKFDILGLRLNNRLTSIMDQEIIIEDDITIPEIEKEILCATLSMEKPFDPYKEEIYEIFLDLKEGTTTTSSPNYRQIKSQLEKSLMKDKELFSQFLLDLRKKRRLEEKDITVKKHEERKPSKKGQEIEKKSNFSEVGSSEILEDDDFDDLIDDGDLD